MPALERARRRVERVDRRVDALLRDRPRERDERVEVGERVRRRRVGEVVGGHVDRLHRGDRALVGRGDALLQLPHLGRERRLVADGARHPAEQRRDLRARLHEAEDVVDEEQHVPALALVAEVLGHRQAGQRDAQARARRLVHLTEDERRVGEHARLGHLEPEVVALARPLADAGEHRVALVLARDAADQLLDQNGLAEAGAAEEADLAAAHERRDEVDHLDAGLEDLHRRVQRVERRRVAVDRPALRVGGQLLAIVDRLAEHVPEPAERLLADRDGDRRAGVDHVDRRAGCRRWRPSRPRGRGRRRGAAAPPRSGRPRRRGARS